MFSLYKLFTILYVPNTSTPTLEEDSTNTSTKTEVVPEEESTSESGFTIQKILEYLNKLLRGKDLDEAKIDDITKIKYSKETKSAVQNFRDFVDKGVENLGSNTDVIAKLKKNGLISNVEAYVKDDGNNIVKADNADQATGYAVTFKIDKYDQSALSSLVTDNNSDLKDTPTMDVSQVMYLVSNYYRTDNNFIQIDDDLVKKKVFVTDVDGKVLNSPHLVTDGQEYMLYLPKDRF